MKKKIQDNKILNFTCAIKSFNTVAFISLIDYRYSLKATSLELFSDPKLGGIDWHHPQHTKSPSLH